MIKKILICFLFLHVISNSFSFIEAQENNGSKLSEQFTGKRSIAELGITELVLNNGMKVILKPTEFEEDEVLVRVISAEGYSSLPSDQYATGSIAAQVAMESGLDDLTCDQLSVLLYKHFIELNVKIQPFNRLIEGTTDTDGLPIVLRLVKMIFMQPHFNREAFNTVVKETKANLAKRACDRETNFDDIFKMLNTQNYPFLKPLTPEMLDKADFVLAKDFFEYSFSDPSKFIAIIVGDFKAEDVLSIIAESLGTIQKKETKREFSNQTYPKFPKGTLTRMVKTTGRSESLVRMAFPLAQPLEEMKLQPFEVATEVLESRLREIFKNHFKSSLGISVAYEFPLYPLLYRPWLLIQFRSNPNQVEKIKEVILEEIEKLKQEGPSKNELDKVLSNMKKTDEFWLRENSYWTVTLSNYYIWGWKPENALKSIESLEKLTPLDIKKLISEYIPEGNYTLINFHP